MTMTQTQTFTRRLPVKLTEEESAKVADQLQAVVLARAEAEAELEELKSDHAERLKEAKASIDEKLKEETRLALMRKKGIEERDVACVEVPATTGEERIHVLRTDTGEVVQTRAMSGDERARHRQGDLFAGTLRDQLVAKHGEAWVVAMEASVQAQEAKGLSDEQLAPAPGEFVDESPAAEAAKDAAEEAEDEEDETVCEECALAVDPNDDEVAQRFDDEGVLRFRHKGECPPGPFDDEAPGAEAASDEDDVGGATPVDDEEGEDTKDDVGELVKLRVEQLMQDLPIHRSERANAWKKLWWKEFPGKQPPSMAKALQMVAQNEIARERAS